MEDMIERITRQWREIYRAQLVEQMNPNLLWFVKSRRAERAQVAEAVEEMDRRGLVKIMERKSRQRFVIILRQSLLRDLWFTAMFVRDARDVALGRLLPTYQTTVDLMVS